MILYIKEPHTAIFTSLKAIVLFIQIIPIDELAFVLCSSLAICIVSSIAISVDAT